MTVERSVTINLNENDIRTLMQARNILEDMVSELSDLEDDNIVLIKYGGGTHQSYRNDIAKAFISLDNLI